MSGELAAALLPAGISPAVACALVTLSFFTSALSAAVGIGGGVALIVAMASFLPPATVLPVHGVVQLGSNAGRAFLMRDRIAFVIVGWFVIGAVVGAAVAGRVFISLESSTLQLILALFVLYSVWGPKLGRVRIPDHGFSLVGLLAAFCTMFVGATGPLVAAFWSPVRLAREGVVATHAACMTLQHALKALAFGFLGFQFAPWGGLLVAMIASGFVGTMLGRKMLRRLDDELFARIFNLVLTVLALRLLWNAVRA